MLSGHPDSDAARAHARELLGAAHEGGSPPRRSAPSIIVAGCTDHRGTMLGAPKAA